MTRSRGWELARNPAYAGKAPSPQEAVCHDGSPFLSFAHGCGYRMHMHETQLPPTATEILTRCKGCGEAFVLEADFVRAAFARMRKEGWIAE